MSEFSYVRLLGRPNSGTPIRMSKGVADDLVARGIAEIVDPPPEPSPAETAMVEPPANAMRPRGRARRIERR